MSVRCDRPAFHKAFSAALALGIFCGLARAEAPINSQAHANTATMSPSFEAYRILIDRNIFDATRKAAGGSSQGGDNPAPASQTLRLMGTWIEGDRALALFEGLPENSHETVAQGGAIAGYQIEQIRPDAVVLDNDQGTTGLRVGAGLAKGENGIWTVVDAIVSMGPPAPEEAASEASPPAPETRGQASTPAEQSDRKPPKKPWKHLRKETEP